jgi:hypothetical protein
MSSDLSYQKQVNEDFKSFFAEFSKNRKFQIERIVFPLSLYTENEQGKSVIKKLSQKSWIHTDFIGLKKINKKNLIEIEVNSSTEAKVIYSMEDNGVYVIHYFTKKAGKWYLNKISDESD